MKKVREDDLTHVVGGNFEPPHVVFPEDDGGDNPTLPIPPLPKPTDDDPVGNPGIRWPPRIPSQGGRD